ncbi:hypothetical protein Hanom_Chr03g00209561 [Helianthus anomalus]
MLMTPTQIGYLQIKTVAVEMEDWTVVTPPSKILRPALFSNACPKSRWTTNYHPNIHISPTRSYVSKYFCNQSTEYK